MGRDMTQDTPLPQRGGDDTRIHSLSVVAMIHPWSIVSQAVMTQGTDMMPVC